MQSCGKAKYVHPHCFHKNKEGKQQLVVANQIHFFISKFKHLYKRNSECLLVWNIQIYVDRMAQYSYNWMFQQIHPKVRKEIAKNLQVTPEQTTNLLEQYPMDR